MIARCERDASHKRFITVAHVMEEWLVDERGNWIETRQSLETTHPPNPGNTWTCAECGATAVVVTPTNPGDSNDR